MARRDGGRLAGSTEQGGDSANVFDGLGKSDSAAVDAGGDERGERFGEVERVDLIQGEGIFDFCPALCGMIFDLGCVWGLQGVEDFGVGAGTDRKSVV